VGQSLPVIIVALQWLLRAAVAEWQVRPPQVTDQPRRTAGERHPRLQDRHKPSPPRNEERTRCALWVTPLLFKQIFKQISARHLLRRQAGALRMHELAA
jgi:hypothetical protein